MLWDSVFEFFVKYVFGGIIDYDAYGGLLGNYYLQEYDGGFNLTTSEIFIKFGQFYIENNEYAGVDNIYTPIGNYFSLIATIITMVIIVVLCCLFIKRIVSLVGGLIR